MMWAEWDSFSYGWRDDLAKIRIQSLRKLVEVFALVKEREKNRDVLRLLKWASSPWGYPTDPDAVAEQLGMSRRTAQDYLTTVRAIAALLMEGFEEDGQQEPLLEVRRTGSGLSMSSPKLFDLETEELKKLKEWLEETLDEIDEELEYRYEDEEGKEDE